MDAATAQHFGSRLLGEIEEESLDDLIKTLKTSTLTSPNGLSSPCPAPQLPIPHLAALASRYQKATQSAPPPLLSLSGRFLPFLYHLISTLLAAPHSYAVVLIDTDGRFDVTRLVAPPPPPPATTRSRGNTTTSTTTTLATAGDAPESSRGPPPDPSYPATLADLKHLYVYHPSHSSHPAQHTRSLIAQATEHILYAPHASRARRWWGTIVIGGGGGGGDVVASWKGWLECRREEVPGFGIGMSLEEALLEREARARAVEGRAWEAVGAKGRLGVYRWDGVRS